MGQLTVRKVDDKLIRRLKIRAAEHGRSAEAEHREILGQALQPEASPDIQAWLLEINRLSEEIGAVSGDSTDIIRAVRDERRARRWSPMPAWRSNGCFESRITLSRKVCRAVLSSSRRISR